MANRRKNPGWLTRQPGQMNWQMRSIYDYIVEVARETSHVPTIREIADHFGWRSTNTVQRYMVMLAEDGLLIRHKDKRYALPHAHTFIIDPAAWAALTKEDEDE